MFKCLYIAGHIWMVQGDTAINLNLVNTIKSDGTVMTTVPVRGSAGANNERLSIDRSLYNVLAECDRQATEKLMGEQ